MLTLLYLKFDYGGPSVYNGRCRLLPPEGGDFIRAYCQSWSDACALMGNGYKVVSVAYFTSVPEVVSIILEKK
uniref:Uncharacterized protein n=1 Tax=Myoviridae sp. ctagO6 TaxID=2826667 RepID=A0A8S5NNE0_9CAUD|nr:MAG TPA: hypothetical protein [Myoviridae sp. ctagO6]DAG39403.1 MAG TPA: hypothetical protein [Caudoviricetes sp.]